MSLKICLPVLLAALCVATNVDAGVDYYSGTSSPFSSSGDTDPDTWSPLGTDVNAGAAVLTTSHNTSILSWVASTASNYSIYVSDIGSKAKVLSTVDGSGSFGNTGTGTYTATVKNLSSAQTLYDGANTADGFTQSSENNYIGWAIEFSGSLYAIGWANIDYSFVGSGNDPGDTFTIKEWAYSYGSAKTGYSATSIDFGDKTLNNSGVPEPGSLAVFGLIGLGAIASRRRR